MAQDTTRSMPNQIRFALAGMSGMGATILVQPLDLVKNRMQLSGVDGKKQYKNSLAAIVGIAKSEGIFAMYSGLSAGLLRQATYTTTRMGVNEYLMERYRSKDGTPPGFLGKLAIGAASGASGSFVGTPAEVALVRMTADGRLPPEERRNYKNVFEALLRISREEGVLALWRGVVPTMGRAMVVNMVQLSTYAQTKEYLISAGYFEPGILCFFVSSMTSGFLTTVFSMPVDIAKTRIQNMKSVDGKAEYKGTQDVLVKVVKNEGVFALWKGFTPYWARLGPHTVFTFIFFEALKNFYADYTARPSKSKM